MKEFSFIFLLVCLFILAPKNTILAQDISDYSSLKPEDYENISLPPLDILFENAKNSPTYQLAQV